MAVAAADFPQLCESCLGSSPYVKMQRTPIGGTCKICIRPFELFKWRPGRGESYKRTEICRTCAEMKNICQTCILDLRFGLPSQLRDAVLSYADSKENSHASTHESDVTRDYKMQEYLQNPTTRNNQDESDNRLIKIARAVAEQRHQHRITVSAQPSSAAMNAPITSMKSNSVADDVHLLGDLKEQEFSIIGHEFLPQPSITALAVQDSDIPTSSNKKRKFASSILPPRPPGPPPSWAFRNSERCDGLREGGTPLNISSADDKT